MLLPLYINSARILMHGFENNTKQKTDGWLRRWTIEIQNATLRGTKWKTSEADWSAGSSPNHLPEFRFKMASNAFLLRFRSRCLALSTAVGGWRCRSLLQRHPPSAVDRLNSLPVNARDPALLLSPSIGWSWDNGSQVLLSFRWKLSQF